MSHSHSFNASPSAPPLFKERALWIVLLGLFFFLIYGSANEISAVTAPHPSFYWQWERNIPFIPELILPYMSSDLVFVIALLVAPTRLDIQKLGMRLGLAIIISALFFLIMPLQFSFERPAVSGWPFGLFELLSLDKPYNQFPSLHISLGFLAWLEIRLRLKGIAGRLVSLWFISIAASTLLIYQHHVIDLIGAIVVTFLLFHLIPPTGRGSIPLNFITPRHLHMALRYLVIATAVVIGAFNTEPAIVLILGWIAVSLIGVSISYTTGFNGFMNKKRGHYPLTTWILFWPFIIGSRLNWYFWKSRIPLMAEIQPGIWIGASPAVNHWRQLKESGINTVIDLAPELSSTVPDEMRYHHLPLLDIAIPAPELLHEVARKIHQQQASGGIYIHCALGMSRSVLGVSAWMMMQGASREEALDRVDQVRPERVARPYITISLDLYEQYLKTSKTTVCKEPG
ncbi:MAG: dual specificity protein phosphatase family protein [Sedimenticola sp.]